MFGPKSKIKKTIWNQLSRKVVFWNERKGREEFFYKALKALTFNGINGDYAEFGCCVRCSVS